MYRFQPTNFHVSILGLEHSDLGFVSASKNVCLKALEYICGQRTRQQYIIKTI